MNAYLQFDWERGKRGCMDVDMESNKRGKEQRGWINAVGVGVGG